MFDELEDEDDLEVIEEMHPLGEEDIDDSRKLSRKTGLGTVSILYKFIS